MDNHGLYETARAANTSKEVRATANEKMKKSYESITLPKGIERMKNE